MPASVEKQQTDPPCCFLPLPSQTYTDAAGVEHRATEEPDFMAGELEEAEKRARKIVANRAKIAELESAAAESA